MTTPELFELVDKEFSNSKLSETQKVEAKTIVYKILTKYIEAKTTNK